MDPHVSLYISSLILYPLAPASLIPSRQRSSSGGRGGAPQAAGGETAERRGGDELDGVPSSRASSTSLSTSVAALGRPPTTALASGDARLRCAALPRATAALHAPRCTLRRRDTQEARLRRAATPSRSVSPPPPPSLSPFSTSSSYRAAAAAVLARHRGCMASCGAAQACWPTRREACLARGGERARPRGGGAARRRRRGAEPGRRARGLAAGVAPAEAARRERRGGPRVAGGGAFSRGERRLAGARG